MPDLDFSQVTTPPCDGDVLVLPNPQACLAAARANATLWDKAEVRIAGSTLSSWRHRTRTRFLGQDDRPVVVVGHQPEMIHAGVWAKHIVAQRLAQALGGVAVNLIVDNDTLRQDTLSVPYLGTSGVDVKSIPIAVVPAGWPCEHIEAKSVKQVEAFRDAVETVMGDGYEESQMPAFVDGIVGEGESGGWVAQVVAGRRAIESRFEVELHERRVSATWWTPLLVELLERAEQFVAVHNRALADYRKTYRVRGAGRPIPDLIQDGDRFELPIWVVRPSQPRRRLFIQPSPSESRLFADAEEIGHVSPSTLAAWAEDGSSSAELDGWRFRPRALTLTLWARLFLADYFLHGIGGVKYDRITDTIIADFFGLRAPAMGCVSATLHLDLPVSNTTIDTINRLKRDLRDLRWNPQRHLSPGIEVDQLLEQRRSISTRAVELRAVKPADRHARRRLFDEVREVNTALLAAAPQTLDLHRTELAQATNERRHDRIATSREYFFGLFPKAKLDGLLDALPSTSEFRV